VVERFDPKKGAKLSLTRLVESSIHQTRAANQFEDYLVCRCTWWTSLSSSRRRGKAEEVLGREPSDDELAAELDYTVAPRETVASAAVRTHFAHAPSVTMRPTASPTSSKTKMRTRPTSSSRKKTNNALVHEMIETLDAREQAILRQRFGLDGDDRKTLEEIGEQFGVTRERIRQIEEFALRKLRKRIQETRHDSVAA